MSDELEDIDNFGGFATDENGRALTRRPYTLSDAALKQRREASARSTGPRTEDGKAASSRNAYKHGRCSTALHVLNDWRVGAFGRPCQTTCAYHPDNPNVAMPCHLVTDGLTKAGGDCLDKTVFVQAFDAILSAMNGAPESLNEILSGEVAGAMELLRALREEVSRSGLVVGIPLTNREGDVVLHPKTGEMIMTKFITNPGIANYIKLLGEMGINLPELLATPRATAAAAKGEPQANAFVEMLGGAMARVTGQSLPPAQSSGRVFDHEGDD